jgi:hypothetical protein
VTSNEFTAVVSAAPSLLHVANPLGQDLPAQTPALVQQSNTDVDVRDEPIPSVLSDLVTSNEFTAVVSAAPSLLHVANPLGQDLPAQTPALVQQSNTDVDVRDEPIPSVLSDLVTSNEFTAVVSAAPSLLHVANPLGQDLPAQTPALVQQSNTDVTMMAAASTMAPLSQADHPYVRFWMQSDWKTHRKTRSGFSNIDPISPSAYLEDNEGQPVDADRAAYIRNVAHKLWFLLRERKIHPTTWGEVTAEADGIYKCGMAALLIEMRLCKDNWKATYLATQNYPSWYNNHVKKKTIGDVKKEPKTEGVDEPAPDKKKRTANDVAMSSSSKRFKKSTLVTVLIIIIAAD